MTLPVLFQLGQFGLSLCLGAALGLLYTLLGAVRAVRPRLTALCDGIFGHILLPALLLFALSVGRGEFRLFFYPGILLGAAAWFLGPGRTVGRAAAAFLRAVGSFGRSAGSFVLRLVKKFEKIKKISFLLRKNKV